MRGFDGLGRYGPLPERQDEVVAVWGPERKPLSVERTEVLSVLWRLRQALDRLDYVPARRADPEHAQMRADLEQAARVLERWESGPG